MDLTRYYHKLENLNYSNFLEAFKETSFYLRLVSLNNFTINNILEELINSVFSKQNSSNFDYLFNSLFFIESATEEEIAEVNDILCCTNLDVIHKVPNDEYLNSYYYDFENNLIVPNTISNQPYSSWSYDIHTSRWWPPTPKPDLTEEDILNNLEYKWDEDSLQWILVNSI